MEIFLAIGIERTDMENLSAVPKGCVNPRDELT